MPEELDVDYAIRSAVDWLLRTQDSPSGGWPERPGQSPSTLNTAEAIIALLDSRLVNCGDKAVQKGIAFLKRHHRACPVEADKAAWPREVQVEHGEQSEVLIPDLIRTAFAVQAIARCEGTDSDLIKDAVAWIKDVQNKDNGGWGFRRGGLSGVTPTCFALRALIEAGAAGMQDCSDPILKGLAFLVKGCRNADGSFGSNETLKPVHTINAALLIQSARARAGLGAYIDEERQAIDWLGEHPDRAISQVEEEMEIGQSPGSGNYSFSFMTPALLLELLMRSVDKENRKGRLPEFAMLALKDMRDESMGAFKGARVFSWSTSKVLAGLSSVEQHVGFPVRRTESKGFKAGQAILIFSVFLSSAVIYLTMNNQFHALQATFFMLLMLCSLLAYGLIGEKTFSELFKTVWGSISESAKGGKDRKKEG